jgi:hypothetical protein
MGMYVCWQEWQMDVAQNPFTWLPMVEINLTEFIQNRKNILEVENGNPRIFICTCS